MDRIELKYQESKKGKLTPPVYLNGKAMGQGVVVDERPEETLKKRIKRVKKGVSKWVKDLTDKVEIEWN